MELPEPWFPCSRGPCWKMKGARDGDASVNSRVPYPGERLMQLLVEPDTGCFDLGALSSTELYDW